MRHDPTENEDGKTAAAVVVDRTNTILYCRRWSESVAFYTDIVGLDVTFANDWFVEFCVGASSHLSIANTERATIATSNGAGITLSWHVADIDATHQALSQRGAAPDDIHTRWGARAFHLHDPEGHRIEFWSQPLTG